MFMVLCIYKDAMNSQLHTQPSLENRTIFPVILAGGQGTRLWPASLPDIPKQFINIGGKSLMCQAIERAKAVSEKEIIIITGKSYIPLFPKMLAEELRQANIDINSITLIGEPCARNTAPAIALAVRYVQERDPNAILLVITADHLISPTKTFVQDVLHACATATSIDNNNPLGYIVTFGIKPSHPETGYGYIEQGEQLSRCGKKVKAFKEKPDYETAIQYFEQQNFLWNSGMFCFPVSLMKQEFQKYCSTLYKTIFLPLSKTMWKHSVREGFKIVVPQGFDFSNIQKISIDYAIMEQSTHIAVVQANFEWNDIGSWDEAAPLLEDNAKFPQYKIDSENTSVYSDIPVGIIGISDISVIIKNNRALIMKKGRGQEVSEIAKKTQKPNIQQ